MKAPSIFQALEPVIQAFTNLEIRYQIGGSVASSAYGIARATLDVDLVADLQEFHIDPLVHALRNAYYLDEDRIRDAVARRSSFNVIHLESMIKVDVFVLKSRPYDRTAFSRSRLEQLGDAEAEHPHYLASPEDVVLNKLDCYRQGGSVSDRQWNDVLGILKVQQHLLDFEYLRQWAEVLGLSDLLRRALQDSGLTS
jgi:hypothetical protein